jgi:NAD(P)-dependent dehydrogenase (short-subunit alcohol dehydrogenase family)
MPAGESGRETAAVSSFDAATFVVTGAGSGIGRATAARLASGGAAVACLDVVGESAEETVSEITAGGGKARAYTCDVSNPGAVSSTVDLLADELGAPAGLANIAGVGRFVHTVDHPLEDWERMIGVNLTGTFLMCRAVLPHLLARGGGPIVNTSSTAGLMGQPYSAAYCASKGGVTLLTKALAVEYLERGVRVNAVAPGGIETPILGSFGLLADASMKLVERMVSPFGFGQPEEVAGVFSFLLSDEARYMTGAIVPIDGGVTA